MFPARAARLSASCLLVSVCRGDLTDPRVGAHLDACAEDGGSVALVQQRARMHVNKYGAPLRFAASASHSANASASPLPVPPLLFCTAFSHLCEEPFNCQTLTQEEVDTWAERGNAFAGEPNLRAWCLNPWFMPLMTRCAAGDISGAGKLQYDLTVAGLYGPTTMEMDGSYCFLEGHCVNEAVSNDTTLEDAAKMCDDRFGHEAWTQFGRSSAPPADIPGFGFDDIPDGRRNGFMNRTQTRPFLLAACAMGNFHCDVLYCRENYCKNPYYVEKYGHFLKENGWVQ